MRRMIEVAKQDDETYAVTVAGARTTRHQVTLTPDYHRKLTDGKVPPEKLIENAFAFLLEREPNTSILAQFELPLIGRYFPEFEATIRKRVEAPE